MTRHRVRPIATIMLLAIATSALDWLTKDWAERTLSHETPIPVVGDTFRLTLIYNYGSAFGLFANGGTWLLAVTGIISLALAVFLINAAQSRRLPRGTWALSLILGGAVANFADRWPDARVTDFLDVGLGATRWPAFNVADSSIVVGMALLVLMNTLAPASTKAPHP